MGNLHLNVNNGDFIFAGWEEDGAKRFRRKVHEIRAEGFRKVNEYHGYLNIYQVYRNKKTKKCVTVTMMCI